MLRKLEIVLVCLALVFFFAACSKNKGKKATEDNARTVDLAELELGDEDKQIERSAELDGLDEMDEPSSAADTEKERAIARLNDKAAIDDLGNPRRGLPAAQVEAEAQADVVEADEVFDFSEKSKTKTPRRRANQVRSPSDKKLAIQHLIDVKEIREQTAYSGVIELSELPGQDASSRYNAMRWIAGETPNLGLSLQVWKPGNESAAAKRFQDLYEQSFAGSKMKGLANDAYSSEHHRLRELTFYDAPKRAVVSIACSEDLCSAEQLSELARRIQKRL
ncbi:MAG: hypothetical protein WC966_11650 [Bradymonadales bacterium]|jgi:hypothetical protein